MLAFLPPRTFRYSLKRGMTGADVWALQINLAHVGAALVLDGVFGPKTETAVRAFQATAHPLLTVDGVAGPATQRGLCLHFLDREAFRAPRLVVSALIEDESGYYVGAVNTNVAGGIDVGWTQFRVYADAYSDAAFRSAYDAAVAIPRLATELDEQARRFYGKPGATTAQRAWELAIGSWNWPAAAQEYADASGDTWQYVATYWPSGPSDGGVLVRHKEDGSELRRYTMATVAQWVVLASAGREQTGREWFDAYVDSKTVGVLDWPTP